MTRDEHLIWAQRRALKYVDANEVANAYASFVSDLCKHPELVRHPGLELGMALIIRGGLTHASQMRHWIEGFR